MFQLGSQTLMCSSEMWAVGEVRWHDRGFSFGTSVARSVHASPCWILYDIDPIFNHIYVLNFFYNMVCDVVCVICVIHHEDPWAWLPPSNSPCRSSTQTRSGRNVQSRSAHRPKQSVDEGVASSLLDLLRLPCCTHRGRR